jgi:hypothetical protein
LSERSGQQGWPRAESSTRKGKRTSIPPTIPSNRSLVENGFYAFIRPGRKQPVCAGTPQTTVYLKLIDGHNFRRNDPAGHPNGFHGGVPGETIKRIG